MWTTVNKGFQQVFMWYMGPFQRGMNWQIVLVFFLNNNLKTQPK